MKSLYLLIFTLLLAFSAAADARPHPHKKYHRHHYHNGSHLGIVIGASPHLNVSVSTQFVITSGNTHAVISVGSHHHSPYCGHHYSRGYRSSIQTGITGSYSAPRYVSGQAREIKSPRPTKARVVSRKNQQYFSFEDKIYGVR